MLIGDCDLILFFDGAEPGFCELERLPPIDCMPWPPIRLLCYWTRPREYGEGPFPCNPSF